MLFQFVTSQGTSGKQWGGRRWIEIWAWPTGWGGGRAAPGRIRGEVGPGRTRWREG